MIYDNTLTQIIFQMAKKVQSFVVFDEPSSLGGLPQNMSEVIRIVLSPTLCGGHSGN